MANNDKTEKPSAQRLKKAREEGQFLTAREMVGALQFLAMVYFLGHFLPDWERQWRLSTIRLLERSVSGELSPIEWTAIIRGTFIDTLTPLLYVGATLFTLTAGCHFAMTKLGFSLKKLIPKVDRFNPANRLKELPKQNIRSTIVAVLLLAVLGIWMRMFYTANGERLLRLPLQSLPTAAATIGSSLEDLLWKASAVFVLFGAVDLFQQYRKYHSSLKMTKQEVKEENKRNEGSPELKARIRRLRRELLRRQMMKEVPKATAIVVNPTHFAVALRYEADTMGCPLIVAKGKNWLALRIREVATKHQVPIIENPPLARALYDSIDVGRSIPPEFYRAIAEILAYVYKLMGTKLPGSMHAEAIHP